MTRNLLAWALACCLLAAGCGKAHVIVNLVLPVAPNPYESLDELRFDVLVEDTLEESRTVSFDGPGRVITRLSVSPALETVIVVRGFSNGVVTAEGRTRSLDLLPGDTVTESLFFAPKTRFNEVGPLNDARGLHTATLLGDDRVLIVGGVRDNGPGGMEAAVEVEIYDPTCACFRTLNVDLTLPPRYGHSTTLLANGQVFVYGGIDPGTGMVRADGVLLLLDGMDVEVRTATLTGDMPALALHASQLFSTDIEVHLAGFAGAYNMEVFSSGQVTVTNLDRTTMAFTGSAIADLGGNTLLLAGGYGNAAMTARTEEVGRFDPAGVVPLGATGGSPTLSGPRSRLSASPLPGGDALIFGGEDDTTGTATTIAEVYVAAVDGIVAASDTASIPRSDHTSSTLRGPDSSVLLAGGGDDVSELFHPADDPTTPDSYEGSFVTHERMISDRYLHTATTLRDGTVLFVGGFDMMDVGIGRAEVYNP